MRSCGRPAGRSRIALPFRYECNGVETFFSNGLDPEPTARRVFNMHWPETLAQWLNAELQRRAGNSEAPPMATLKGRIRQAEPLNRAGMWPAQIRAVENLEASVREGRRRALIQMATGGGKTFKATSAAYRLIRQAGARQVLFLVDRGNLGRQAFKEFQAYATPDEGRPCHELTNVVNLSSNRIDAVNKVVITTIQRPDGDSGRPHLRLVPAPCGERSPPRAGGARQGDYALLGGSVRTQVGEQGATVKAEPGLGVLKRNRQTREERWQALEEVLSIETSDLDRSLVVPHQIRLVLRTIYERLFTELFPGRTGLPTHGIVAAAGKMLTLQGYANERYKHGKHGKASACSSRRHQYQRHFADRRGVGGYCQ